MKKIYLKKNGSIYSIRDVQVHCINNGDINAMVYVDFVKGEVDESEYFSAYLMQESIEEAANANEYEVVDFSPTIVDWFRKYFKFELTEKECELLINVMRSESLDIFCDGYEVQVGSDGTVDQTFRDYDPDRLGLINWCMQFQIDFLNERQGEISNSDRAYIEYDIKLLDDLLTKHKEWENE